MSDPWFWIIVAYVVYTYWWVAGVPVMLYAAYRFGKRRERLHQYAVRRANWLRRGGT